MNSNIKKTILTISIFVIIIIIVLISVILKKVEINQKDDIGDKGIEKDYSSLESKNVTEKIEYYTVSNILNNYVKVLNKNNSIYYIDNQIDEEQQQEYLCDIIDVDYMKLNNINKQNILNKLEIYDQSLIFVPIELKVIERENVNKYFAYGVLQNFENKYIQDIYVYVNLDKKNKTYSIEPIYQDIKNIDKLEYTNNNTSIQKNEYNTFQNQNITYEYITNAYLSNYKRLVYCKPELIYNLLDEEYKNSRFENYDDFKNYINDNYEYIKKIRLEKYQVNNFEDTKEYRAVDQYNNEYIFIENIDSKYKIKLDNYTIYTDEVKKIFNDATESQRAKIYVDKVFKMINNDDYKNLYNYLYIDFKNNYFDNEEKFEKFLKNNLFKFNKVEYNTQTKEGNRIYSCDLNIKNRENENEQKNMNIVIKVEDNYNFKFSFSM